MRPYTSLNSDFKRISPCFMPTNIRFPDDLDLLYATMKKTGELKRLDDDTCSTDRWRRQKLRFRCTLSHCVGRRLTHAQRVVNASGRTAWCHRVTVQRARGNAQRARDGEKREADAALHCLP